MGLRSTSMVFTAVWLSGCATPYAFQFQQVQGSALPPAGVTVTLSADPVASALKLELDNATEQVVQVDWSHVAVQRPDGSTTVLAPDHDLGWVKPGARQSVMLTPFVMPPDGEAAKAYDGKTLQVEVPVVVRQERSVVLGLLAVKAVPR